MASYNDGPSSARFRPVELNGNFTFEELQRYPEISRELSTAIPFAHSGSCVAWGISFEVGRPVVLRGSPVEIKIEPTTGTWFVFLHTSDIEPLTNNPDGFISPMRGEGRLGEHAANYVLIYEDGTEERVAIKRRHQIGSCHFRWGEQCTDAVPAVKPRPLSFAFSNQPKALEHIARFKFPQEWEERQWGIRQTQVLLEEGGHGITTSGPSRTPIQKRLFCH
ncbi:MAG: hypothetical protein E5X37_30030 [Mesorhizobium sp.]|nr:MAG: hypothetical protein E5X37_30030 [Mesorhizobium sp.]